LVEHCSISKERQDRSASTKSRHAQLGVEQRNERNNGEERQFRRGKRQNETKETAPGLRIIPGAIGAGPFWDRETFDDLTFGV